MCKRPSSPPVCKVCEKTRICTISYCATKKIFTLSRIEYDLLHEFREKVESYVEKCDELGIIQGRNYFVKIINDWKKRKS